MSKILIVDDEKMITDTLSGLIEMVLEYEVVTCNDPSELFDDGIVQSQEFDMVISDFMMPKKDGIEVLKAIKEIQPEVIPILLTGYSDKQNAIKSINEVGLYYYMEKPWDNNQLISIVKNGIEKKKLEKEVKENYVVIKKRNDEISRLYDIMKKDFHSEMGNIVDVVTSLANLVEAKDSYTEGHTRRVSALGKIVGEKMGIEGERLQALELAGIVHDIGKVSTPDGILNKNGRLTDFEFVTMKQHPEVGERILKPLTSMNSVLHSVRHHHEKLDGSGYPDGLKGDQIILETRILAVVDIFDALYTERPYKNRFSLEKSIQILHEEADDNKICKEVVKVIDSLASSGELFSVYEKYE